MKNLLISISPHIHTKNDTSRVMLDVLIALMPALVAATVIFGSDALLRCLFSVAACVLLEYLWNKLMKKEQTVKDLSAAVTGLLLAFNVPATLPYWELFIGDVIAIIIVKMLFGGLGCNFVNPALVGRVSLMVSFPADMTNYVTSVAKGTSAAAAEIVTAATDAVTGATGAAATVAQTGADLLTGATPLAIADKLGSSELMTLLLGQHGGVLGETCALALLIGGVYLVIRKVIKPLIPLCFMGSCALFTFLFGGAAPLMSLLMGGMLLGSIFMATDYVTSPITDKGKVIFGLGCGFLAACTRCFASAAEGVSFAILLMNLLVPYINEGTRTKPLGGIEAK